MNNKIKRFLDTKTFVEIRLANMESDKLIDGRFVGGVNSDLTVSDNIVDEILKRSDINVEVAKENAVAYMQVLLPNKFILSATFDENDFDENDIEAGFIFEEENIYKVCIDKVRTRLREYLTFMACTAYYTLEGDK